MEINSLELLLKEKKYEKCLCQRGEVAYIVIGKAVLLECRVHDPAKDLNLRPLD
jgi:hypothetical protein